MAQSDDVLVSQVLATGDRRAFSALVDRHQRLVRGLLARLTGNRADADDLAQDTFVQAWQRIATYRGEGSFKAWLCQIAYSRFLMSARKARSRGRLMEGLRADPPLLDEAAAQPGLARDLDRALVVLGDEERACIVLCFASGLSHGETAEVTGLPLGTVKSHITRGRAKLKTWFDRQESLA
ncbi:RNA polymerase sigma factor [Glycocaulis abyssi]|uniref:RNA polymerase sigma factor n=1 Tax=Glycocaulis abyssi TaxID=1433403 RepID=A0ABV9NAR9_9PROT